MKLRRDVWANHPIYRVMAGENEDECIGYVTKIEHTYDHTVGRGAPGLKASIRTRTTKTVTWVASEGKPGSGGFYLDLAYPGLGGRRTLELRSTPPFGERTRTEAVQLVLDWYEQKR